jgi:hypothetical protein
MLPPTTRFVVRLTSTLGVLAACAGESPTVPAPPTSSASTVGTPAPSTSAPPPTADAPRPGASATGTVYGTVYAPGGAPLAGATVELGRWAGDVQQFRDSAGAGGILNLNDPRVTVVARTTTDAAGAYAFAGRDGMTQFVVRALPPAGSAATGAYFPSVFWLFGEPRIRIDVRLR